MTFVLVAAAVMLSMAALLLVLRMTLGPTILDRSIALDVFMAVTVSATALHAAYLDEAHTLPVLLVLAGSGFVGAVSVARYASRRDDLAAGNPDERTGGVQ